MPRCTDREGMTDRSSHPRSCPTTYPRQWSSRSSHCACACVRAPSSSRSALGCGLDRPPNPASGAPQPPVVNRPGRAPLRAPPTPALLSMSTSRRSATSPTVVDGTTSVRTRATITIVGWVSMHHGRGERWGGLSGHAYSSGNDCST